MCDSTPTEALHPYCNQWYSCESAIAVHTYLPVRDGILSETGVWDRVRVCRYGHVNRLDISKGRPGGTSFHLKHGRAGREKYSIVEKRRLRFVADLLLR